MSGFDKEKLAKEWLIFICCFIFMIIASPLLLSFSEGTFSLEAFIKHLFNLLEELFFIKIRDNIGAWLLVLFPYIIIQLIRSIMWAVRAIKKADDIP